YRPWSARPHLKRADTKSPQQVLLFKDSRRLDKTSRAWTRHRTIPLSGPASRFLFGSFVKRPRRTLLQPSNRALKVAESRTRRGQGACSKARCRGGEPRDRFSNALGGERACGDGAPWVQRSSRCLLLHAGRPNPAF